MQIIQTCCVVIAAMQKEGTDEGNAALGVAGQSAKRNSCDRLCKRTPVVQERCKM